MDIAFLVSIYAYIDVFMTAGKVYFSHLIKHDYYKNFVGIKEWVFRKTFILTCATASLPTTEPLYLTKLFLIFLSKFYE